MFSVKEGGFMSADMQHFYRQNMQPGVFEPQQNVANQFAVDGIRLDNH